ncbi:MAG: TetR family transcriptional regulator [Gammaproteobacteria bacterium]|jgi:AcrR family transcriptional regulator|nr:TetR family transcriptional regulator [Gammaproteobacteria bacterium]
MTTGEERLARWAALRKAAIALAKTRFSERGFEAVSLQELATELAVAPAAMLRQGLSKPDLLAETIIALNDQQIAWLASRPEATDESLPLQDAVERYLRRVYEFDIEHITLRRMGAAFGWLWAPKYEPRIWEQILALTTPINGILEREGFQDREPMIKALWSLYYTGFRHAVMHRASGEACLAEIRPALQLILRR